MVWPRIGSTRSLAEMSIVTSLTLAGGRLRCTEIFLYVVVLLTCSHDDEGSFLVLRVPNKLWQIGVPVKD